MKRRFPRAQIRGCGTVLNVKGMFFAMQAQVLAMRRGGVGAIVNLSSTGGSRGMPGMSICVASKHAVEGLSRTAALELAAENQRDGAGHPVGSSPAASFVTGAVIPVNGGISAG